MVPLLDLLVFKLGGRLGAEIKLMDALPLTGSMRIALANLQLAHLTIVYPASNLYELAPEIMDYSDHAASNQVGTGMPLTETDPLRPSAIGRLQAACLRGLASSVCSVDIFGQQLANISR
jgi:hypothetical protein